MIIWFTNYAPNIRQAVIFPELFELKLRTDSKNGLLTTPPVIKIKIHLLTPPNYLFLWLAWLVCTLLLLLHSDTSILPCNIPCQLQKHCPCYKKPSSNQRITHRSYCKFELSLRKVYILMIDSYNSYSNYYY